ncbi:MAG: hypothetical protein JKY61_04355 [Planctomycetes bacterium]|nr:hypothetical protein [Planctomycetota bacterium]
MVFELQVSDGVNTSVDTVTVTVNADNDAPSSNAGANQSVDESSSVQLSGSGVDPEGSGLTYNWVQTSGPAVVLDDANASQPTFSAPDLVANSDITFELQVSDGVNTSVDTVTVTVNADNDAPTSEAGANLSVEEGMNVQLTGSGVDPEGEGLTYTWVQMSGPSVALDDAHAQTPSFDAPNLLANSDIVFELQVSDGVNTSVDTVTISVNADNDAPTSEAGDAQAVDEGDSVQLTGSGLDPEGQGLTYSWVQVSGAAVDLDDANSASPSFEAPEGLANSDLRFELHTSDGTNTSVDSVTITVNADNDAPTASAGPDQSVDELDTVKLVGTGVDPEGRDLAFEWVQISGPTVELDDPTSAEPTFAAPQLVESSEVVFELRVSDGVSTSSDTVRVSILAEDDAPTEVYAGADQSVDELDVVQLSGGAVELEGQDLTYEWVQTSGTPVVLDDASAQNPTFQAPEGLVNSNISFELRVSDGSNEVVDDVTITVRADNDVPTASAGDSYHIEEGQFAYLSGVGLDPEGQGLTYEWIQVSGPEVQLDDVHAAEASFLTPDGVRNTDVVFELHVSDGVNTSVDTITVTVEADDDAPLADAGANGVFQAGSSVVLNGSGTDPEDQGLTYTWVQTEGPPVVLFNADSENPSFNAPGGLGGTLVFEIRVSDGVNTSVDTVRIFVTEEPNFDDGDKAQDERAAQDGEDGDRSQPDSSERADPFAALTEALLTVSDDQEEGPLQEVVGELLHLADAPVSADVRTDLLDLLAPLADGQLFSQVFDTSVDPATSVDAAPSLLGTDRVSDSFERDPAEDMTRAGIGESSVEDSAKPQSAIAKFFGLVRGLAGTSDKADAASAERKSKDIQRRD